MTAARKKAPLRPAKPVAPTCDHCDKPCGTTIVRAASGKYCSMKHRRAREALLAAALEPAPVDVAEVMTQALARREVTPRRFIAPPILTPAGRVILSSWLEGKSPDTARSYQASARHFAAWAREGGHASRTGSEIDAVIGAFQVPEDEGNALVIGWLQEQGGQNRGSIATRCSGLKMLCAKLKGARLIGYVPMFTRPRKLRATTMEASLKYAGVPEAFAAITSGLQGLAKAADPALIDLRDWAMIAVGSELGLRRIELARLDVSDADFARGVILVHGKGRPHKEPMPLPPDSGLVPVLRRWIAARTKAIGPTGPLFPCMGPNPPAGGRLERGSINAMLVRRALQFEVKLAPHDLRRILCTEAIRMYGLVKGRELSRHADTSTLAIYDLSQGEMLSEMTADVGHAIRKRVRDTVKKGKKR